MEKSQTFEKLNKKNNFRHFKGIIFTFVRQNSITYVQK